MKGGIVNNHSISILPPIEDGKPRHFRRNLLERSGLRSRNSSGSQTESPKSVISEVIDEMDHKREPRSMAKIGR